jgi:hypothetical protein
MVLGFDNFYPEPQASFKFPVVPPGVDPDDGDSAVVCFSQAWLPYVLGALQQLTLQATWAGDEATVQLTLDRAMELLNLVAQPVPTCPDILVVKGLRYNPDDNLIEQTFDEGATWQPAEGFDPRHNMIFLYPPPGGLDPACQGAANLTRFIENLVETTLNNIAIAGDATGLALTLLPLVLTLGPYALLFDLVLALAVGLFAAGATAISAAFVPETYDTLLCIFYCNMDDQGRINVGRKEQIEAEIADEIGGLVSLTTSAMFLLMGEVGMSNAAATGDAPADCDECSCACTAIFDFTDNDGGFTSVNYGSPFYSAWTWSAGVGWTQGGGQAEAWLKSPTYPPDITITEIRLTVNVVGATVADPYVFGNSYAHVFTTGSGTFPFPGGVSDAVNNFLQFVSSHSNAATYTISRLEVDWDYCPE